MLLFLLLYKNNGNNQSQGIAFSCMKRIYSFIDNISLPGYKKTEPGNNCYFTIFNSFITVRIILLHDIFISDLSLTFLTCFTSLSTKRTLVYTIQTLKSLQLLFAFKNKHQILSNLYVILIF